MNAKRNVRKPLFAAALLTLASGSVLADPCLPQDLYWCNYYFNQCQINGGDYATCESQYIACLVSIGCTPA
jgi:hypothetical protein